MIFIDYLINRLSKMFPFHCNLFRRKEEFGDYEVIKQNGKDILIQNYGNYKEGYRSAKRFELPVSKLTPTQKLLWKTSVKAGKPINPVTNKVICLDGPTAAMLMILSKRK